MFVMSVSAKLVILDSDRLWDRASGPQNNSTVLIGPLMQKDLIYNISQMANKRVCISSGILTSEEIRIESIWRLETLLLVTSDKESALQWCARRRLIRNTRICDNCQKLCTLQKYNQGIDGHKWCCRPCGFFKSVRDGSFFSGSHLRIQQILILIYAWCCDMSLSQMSHEADVTKNVVTEWCDFMREECTKQVDNHEGIGGTDDNGEAIIVEINKFNFFHRKYNHGIYEEGRWIFGGLERPSGCCFFIEVPDCRVETLVSCIKQYILPGSHIISDEWASYANIERIDQGIYQHSIVNHKQDVNDPFVHIQNIKKLWLRVKMRLKKRFGACDELFMSYLNEFTYRNNIRNEDIFRNFIITLGENSD